MAGTLALLTWKISNLESLTIERFNQLGQRIHDCERKREEHERRIVEVFTTLAEIKSTLAEHNEMINDLINANKQDYEAYLEIKHKQEMQVKREGDERWQQMEEQRDKRQREEDEGKRQREAEEGMRRREEDERSRQMAAALRRQAAAAYKALEGYLDRGAMG